MTAGFLGMEDGAGVGRGFGKNHEGSSLGIVWVFAPKESTAFGATTLAEFARVTVASVRVARPDLYLVRDVAPHTTSLTRPDPVQLQSTQPDST